MSSRMLAASLAIVVILGLAGGAAAQEPSREDQAKAIDSAGKPDAAEPENKGGDAPDAEKPGAARVKTEKATFGGGCFWCMEAIFERMIGVKSVVSGYAGGTVPRPSYELVCTGLTGHAEVIQIEYDPKVVPYEKLLNVFWASHDPTSLNRQGPDSGTQYRSIILYQNEAQKEAARKSYKELTAAGVFSSPIVTELVPLKAFYPADSHHQNYYRKNKNDWYCKIYIEPKLKKFLHK
jgi:peptide-methionine (S)-S-oxide reductase